MRCLRWGRSAYETPRDLDVEAQQLRELGFSVEYQDDERAALDEVEVLIVHSKKRVTAARMDAAPKLRLIVTTTSGVDHIDVAAAQERDIQVARSPLARRDAVIDTCLAMGLSLLRDLPYLQQMARRGDWARAKLPHRPISLLRGLKVGIVGYGVIGQRARQIWEALEAEVQISDPQVAESLSLEELASWSQLLTLHCSLTPTSHRMLNDDIFALMAPGTLVLNTARGPCVDMEALARATHLGGVGLDVFPEEPWPHLAHLIQRPNTLLTPHAAGYHQGLAAAVTEELVATLDAWKQNKPLPHPVFA